LPRVHAELDDFERNFAADRLLLLGHVHAPRPAFANFLQQFGTANAVAGLFGKDCSRDCFSNAARLPTGLEDSVGRCRGFQQLIHFAAEFQIARADLI